MKPGVGHRNRMDSDPNLAPLIAVSVLFHIVLIGILQVVPSLGNAKAEERPKAIMFNIEVADNLGTGLGGVPKKGPAHDGKIELPPEQPTPVAQAPVIEPRDPRLKKTAPPRTEQRKPEDHISNPLREAINQLNEGREGENTRPDGDPNSQFTGPGGAPGGDVCAVYRSRAGRYIRHSGSVPEAAGKSVKIVVTIGSSGGVTSKHITQSSGAPQADLMAMGLVPGNFQAPPPECGNVTLHVTVRFEGGSSAKMPSRPNRNPESRPAVPKEIDRALKELQ